MLTFPPIDASASTPPDPSPELLARAAVVRRAAMDLGRKADSERQQALVAMADRVSAWLRKALA